MMNESNDFIHKLMAVERAIAKEKGDFVLFALVQREEGIGLWDLLISAPWLGTKEDEILDFFARKLKETLTTDELMRLSRIVLFPPDDPRVQHILQLVKPSVNHSHVELSSWALSSMPISHAHILTAVEPQVSQTVT
jgi:hypothetical protein